MGKCVECGEPTMRRSGHLCESCHDEKMMQKLHPNDVLEGSADIVRKGAAAICAAAQAFGITTDEAAHAAAAAAAIMPKMSELSYLPKMPLLPIEKQINERMQIKPLPFDPKEEAMIEKLTNDLIKRAGISRKLFGGDER